MNGAEFADERGWLSVEEREELEQDKAAWPRVCRELRDHTRRFRREHPEAFRDWCLSEIRTAQSKDYADRVRATMAGRREDPVFSFPEGDPWDSAALLRELAHGRPRPTDRLLVRVQELSRLLGVRVRVRDWVEAGCPVHADGRRTLFDVVEVLRWAQRNKPPVDFPRPEALARVAARLEPTVAFLAVARTLEGLREEGVYAEGPETSSPKELSRALRAARAAGGKDLWKRLRSALRG